MTRQKGRRFTILIAVLVIVLIEIIGVILWKLWEYDASERFYNGLRGVMIFGGIRVWP